jgi:hypothetical protein
MESVKRGQEKWANTIDLKEFSAMVRSARLVGTGAADAALTAEDVKLIFANIRKDEFDTAGDDYEPSARDVKVQVDSESAEVELQPSPLAACLVVSHSRLDSLFCVAGDRVDLPRVPRGIGGAHHVPLPQSIHPSGAAARELPHPRLLARATP